MSDSYQYKNIIRNSPGIRLSVLFGSFFLLLFISSSVAVILKDIPFGSIRDRQLCISAVQSLFAFCLPAYVLARFSSNNPSKWLNINAVPSFRGIAGIIIVYLISFPAMEWLIEWNKNLHLPASFIGLENIMRDWENANNIAASSMLQAKGIPGMLMGVLIIGVLTGFSEELFFRGGFQGILQLSSMGKNVSVWLAAVVFSTMHFQFFGFVPRLLMGAYFGYLYLWTQNLWVPIIAHALNNSIVVVVAYMVGVHNVTSIDSVLSFDNVYMPLLSAAITILFFSLFRKVFFEDNNRISKWQKKRSTTVSEK